MPKGKKLLAEQRSQVLDMLIAGTDPKHIAVQTNLSITTIRRIKEAEQVNIEPVAPVIPVAGIVKRSYVRRNIPPVPPKTHTFSVRGIEVEVDFQPTKIRYVDGKLEVR